ncbi:MAG TPA: hypothetical protein VLC46_16345 [Thermoanaerobaculia bacterium]|jgi:hypothetical protein|nr:hypothetical protein [Thermoanaerobaculia bacterium]
MSNVMDLIRSKPSIISDAITGANNVLGATGSGEDKADVAAAAVISIAGAVYPAAEPFEGLALAAVKGIIKIVFDAMQKHGLLQPTPSVVTAPVVVDAPAT